jgi:hypothetical protein
VGVSARLPEGLTRRKQLFLRGYARPVLARRLLLLAAVLMLLAALAAGLAPQRSLDDGAPPPRSELPAGGEVVEVISADAGADGGDVMVRRGDVLKLEVTGNALDSVLIERLDRIEAIEPSTPARFDMLIEAPAGIYPIRLLEADRRIGALQITN